MWSGSQGPVRGGPPRATLRLPISARSEAQVRGAGCTALRKGAASPGRPRGRSRRAEQERRERTSGERSGCCILSRAWRGGQCGPSPRQGKDSPRDPRERCPASHRAQEALLPARPDGAPVQCGAQLASAALVLPSKAEKPDPQNVTLFPGDLTGLWKRLKSLCRNKNTSCTQQVKTQ